MRSEVLYIETTRSETIALGEESDRRIPMLFRDGRSSGRFRAGISQGISGRGEATNLLVWKISSSATGRCLFAAATGNHVKPKHTKA